MGYSFSLGSTELIVKGSFKVVFQELMTHPGEIQQGLSLGTAVTCVCTSLSRKLTLTNDFFEGLLAKTNSFAPLPQGKNIRWEQKPTACLRIRSQQVNPHTHIRNSMERPGEYQATPVLHPPSSSRMSPQLCPALYAAYQLLLGVTESGFCKSFDGRF